jgi:hypothetical protein
MDGKKKQTNKESETLNYDRAMGLKKEKKQS